MSFTIRSTALAALLAVVATGASATINGRTQVEPNNGNGAELQLIVSSATAQLSFQQDLGITISDVLSGASFNIAVNSLFSGSALATASDAKWAVVAFDMTGDTLPDSSGVDNQQLFSTINNAATAFSPTNTLGFTSNDLQNSQSGWFQWVNTVNARGTNITLANGASLVGKSDAAAYWLDPSFNPTNDFSGKIQVGIANSVGATARFYRFTGSDEFDLTLPVNVDQQYGLKFDGSTISSVSAVPEPETFALMLAGLLAVGHMVRRQRRA